jgi:amphi-Trp domain-containing protein
MGEKDEQTLSRLELADYLTNLGEELRQGALSAHGRRWTVPDNLDVEMQFKEKKGRLIAKLSWSWSTLKDYDPAARGSQPRPGFHENGKETAGSRV